MKRHIIDIVRGNTAKPDALTSVDPQCVLLLLSGCLVSTLGYHLQVTPPRLAVDAAREWDSAVDAARQVGLALQLLANRKARLR